MNTVSLINMKGGVGKTTLTVNIAHCLATRRNSNTLVIDIDPQFNATQCLMDPKQYVEHIKNEGDSVINVFDRFSRSLVSSVRGTKNKKHKDLSSIEPIQILERLYLLPGNLELYRTEMSPGEGRENRLNKYLKEINKKGKFDHVIIDTPPTPSVWMTSALLASDYYLIPVKPDPLSFTGIDLLKNIIESKKENYDLDIKCAGVVLNMVESNTIVYRQAIEELDKGEWSKYKYSREIPKRTAIARNQTSRTHILDMEDDKAKRSLTGVVNEMLKKIKKK